MNTHDDAPLTELSTKYDFVMQGRIARMQNDLLHSWKDGPAKLSIVNFVDQVTNSGSSQYVPPEQRVAVFDNDGTLWCEKPMPIELGFILERLAKMATEDASLRDRQP